MKNKNIPPNNKHYYVSIGLVLGLAIGGVIGDRYIHMSLGAVAGMFIGLCWGRFVDSEKRKKSKESLSEED